MGAIMALSLALPACTPGETPIVRSPANIMVGQSYSGKEVTASIGDSVTVRLKSGGGIPYEWTDPEVSDKSVLQLTRHALLPPRTPLPGAPGDEEWTFKALRQGRARVSTNYVSIASGPSPAQAFTITVVVK